jgi:hypothetical protein
LEYVDVFASAVGQDEDPLPPVRCAKVFRSEEERVLDLVTQSA